MGSRSQRPFVDAATARKPGAYLTDGQRLLEVVAFEGPSVWLEDCATDGVEEWRIGRMRRELRIVRG